MRPPSVSQENLDINLFELFRFDGYDGVSLKKIAAATGLKKASLYHRFPGGKKDMATNALEITRKWISTYVHEVLMDKCSRYEKLERILENMNNLYNRGTSPCILRSVLQGESLLLFQNKVKDIFDLLMDDFRQLALLFDHDEDSSVIIAEQAMIQLQGSLVLAIAKKDPTIFQRTLLTIKKLYTN
jgi:AcrR family transcriptional regulator